MINRFNYQIDWNLESDWCYDYQLRWKTLKSLGKIFGRNIWVIMNKIILKLMLKIYFITEKGGLALSLKWTNRAVLFKTYCVFFHNRPFSGICKCSNWKVKQWKEKMFMFLLRIWIAFLVRFKRAISSRKWEGSTGDLLYEMTDLPEQFWQWRGFSR